MRYSLAPIRKEGYMPQKKLRGFALMSQEQRGNVAAIGGKAAHAKGTAHEFNSETARAAAQQSWLKRRTK